MLGAPQTLSPPPQAPEGLTYLLGMRAIPVAALEPQEEFLHIPRPVGLGGRQGGHERHDLLVEGWGRRLWINRTRLFSFAVCLFHERVQFLHVTFEHRVT
ncbi:hypothetical protein JCM17960_16810 [Magnetospira thiophila]